MAKCWLCDGELDLVDVTEGEAVPMLVYRCAVCIREYVYQVPEERRNVKVRSDLRVLPVERRRTPESRGQVLRERRTPCQGTPEIQNAAMGTLGALKGKLDLEPASVLGECTVCSTGTPVRCTVCEHCEVHVCAACVQQHQVWHQEQEAAELAETESSLSASFRRRCGEW